MPRQADFRAGLDDLCRAPDAEDVDDDDDDSGAAPRPCPLPPDWQMDVHCISAERGVFSSLFFFPVSRRVPTAERRGPASN